MKGAAHASALVLCLVVVTLAGCMDPGSPDPADDPEEGPTTSEQLTENQSAIPDLEPLKAHKRTMGFGLAQFLVIETPGPNRSVEFWTTPEQQERLHSGGCRSHEEDAGPNRAFSAVWNRTGLVHYEEWQVEWDIPMAFEVELPDDPPFLVWPGITCAGRITVGFDAEEWFLSESGIRSYDVGDEPDNLLARAVNKSIEIKIPAGQLEAHAAYPIGSQVFMMEGQPLPGTIEQSPPFASAVVKVSHPNEKNQPHEWIIRLQIGGPNPDYETRIPSGMPGHYWFEVRHDQPLPVAAQWDIGFDAWEFRGEVLTKHGFAYPFEVYDQRWNPEHEEEGGLLGLG